ncbi:MAG: histidine triad nucleotide-binding protein [Thiovulaceae bacterium]|nr:histidine triad nucleotide-binding protein [Sulfurimonadaceae bacterium]
MCIFCQIVNKEIPSNVVLENDNYLAFHDLNPKAPVHILVIPKKHTESFHTANGDIFAGLGEFAKEVAVTMGVDKSGYRVITNIGADGGQEVPHLHLHILGGAKIPFGHFSDANPQDNF